MRRHEGNHRPAPAGAPHRAAWAMAARAAASLAVLLAGMAGGGCASTPVAAGPDAQTELAAPPRFESGPLEPATRGIAARDFVRAAGAVARYEILDGDQASDDAPGGQLVERMVLEQRDGADKPVLVRVEERDGRTFERMEFVERGDGALLLAQVDSISERSRSVFAEPLLYAVDLAPAGEAVARSPMRVESLPRGGKRGEGTARRLLRVVGECEVRLSGEPMRAVALDLEFDVELDVATARVRSRVFVVPGRGIVAEVREETRIVLRVLRTTTTETTVLQSVEE